MEIIQRVATVSVIWALPFAAVGIYLMWRASVQNALHAGRFVGIGFGMMVPLWLIGGIGFYLVFANPAPPDAGLAMSVGLAFAGAGATLLWASSALIVFLILRSRRHVR